MDPIWHKAIKLRNRINIHNREQTINITLQIIARKTPEPLLRGKKPKIN